MWLWLAVVMVTLAVPQAIIVMGDGSHLLLSDGLAPSRLLSGTGLLQAALSRAGHEVTKADSDLWLRSSSGCIELVAIVLQSLLGGEA